jgi:hypothetical protein
MVGKEQALVKELGKKKKRLRCERRQTRLSGYEADALRVLVLAI